MSKYNTLWAYIHENSKPLLTLTFDEIGQIAGVPLDHSFLKYKKELYSYGYDVVEISMKAQTVLFAKRRENYHEITKYHSETVQNRKDPQ
jgi:hypothetical protein